MCYNVGINSQSGGNGEQNINVQYIDAFQAKDDYERKKCNLEEKRKRGEDVWMLPSVDSRLSPSSSDEDEVFVQTSK